MSTQSINELSGLNNQSGMQAIFNMEEALGILLGDFLKNQGMQGEGQEKIGESILSQNVSQAQQIDSQIEQEQNESWWKKLLGDVCKYVLPAIISIAAIALGQPELAAMTITMAVLSDTGAFGELAKGVTDACEALGIPDKDAQLIGDVFTITTMVVGGVMLGGGISSIGEDVEGIANKMKEFVKVNAKAIGLGAMGAAGATMNLAPQMAETIAEMSGPSGQTQQELKNILTLVFEVMGMAVGVAGGISTSLGSASDGALSQFASKLSDAFSKGITEVAPEMMDFISENQETLSNIVQKGAKGSKALARLAGGGSRLAIGGIDISMQDIQKNIGYLLADQTTLETSSDLNDRAEKHLQDQLKSQLTAFSQMMNNNNYFQGGQAAAEVLANS